MRGWRHNVAPRKKQTFVIFRVAAHATVFPVCHLMALLFASLFACLEFSDMPFMLFF